MNSLAAIDEEQSVVPATQQQHQPTFNPPALDVYKVLRDHKTKTSDIIEWHFTTVLENIRRKLSLRQAFNDPFTVKLTVVIFNDIVYQAYRAIRDLPTRVGTHCEIQKKNKKVKGYFIKFTDICALRHHFKELTNLEFVNYYFSKTFPNGEKAKLKVTPDEPTTFDYKISTNTLQIRIKYSVINKHGVECTI